jgi:phosphomannomutase
MGRVPSYKRDTLVDRDGSASLLLSPLPYLFSGLVVLAFYGWLQFRDAMEVADSERAMEEALAAVESLRGPVLEIRNALGDPQTLELASKAVDDNGLEEQLFAHLAGRVDRLQDAHVYPPDVFMTDLDEIGENGYILLDMMASARQEQVAPVQFIRQAGESFVSSAALVGNPDEPSGYLVLFAAPELLLDRFDVTDPGAGFIALEHRAGGNSPVQLQKFGSAAPVGFASRRVPVPGSLLQVVVPQTLKESGFSGMERLLLVVLGGLLLAVGLYRLVQSRRGPRPLPVSLDDNDLPPTLPPEPMPGPAPALSADSPSTSPEVGASSRGPGREGHPPEPPLIPKTTGASEHEPSAREPRPAYAADLETGQREQPRSGSAGPRSVFAAGGEPVELSSSIFRAYDIRGIVGETLDPGVARSIGRAVGSLALDSLAGPVVVGRDGRHSGPELVAGLVEGLAASGCDVIEVGPVPTGALYFATHELANGSGVMVTGSHNPPDYNGFKIMIGGQPLSGDMIYGLYERIRSGNLREGAGEVTQQEVLDAYLQRIAGDIQMERPLKVVADCGNGIGGAIAPQVLRAIGAEVVPLYDEVDGDFPNHHPDPSEPGNLRDLIESVRLTDADLGVAFDGDADRLGVVTPAGEIVFPDRVMMLYAQEILSRNPGATIIYDVKCTGHLADIISEAGGKPEMYKTGHSLIKNRMKEVGAPFAGEMSGHFFFKDRWYGFDCGIYSAARLLEILAADPRSPAEVLDALPNSVSTPELKVHLEEGENHAFIERFQREASFEGAGVNTIDGVRADFPDGWGLVRASNTTPVLVLRFDADSQEAMDRVQEAFRAQLLALKPDMELPF